MTRPSLISTFILAICLTSCEQTTTSEKNQIEQKDAVQIDTSAIAVLPFDTTQYWLFKDGKPTELTNEDLLKIDTLLINCIGEYNLEQEKKFKEINDKHPKYKLDKNSFVIDLKRYRRQYVAVINSKGEKEVWINCFCNAHGLNWRKNIIDVNDGGNCYFNLKINLTTKQCYDLMVNGEA